MATTGHYPSGTITVGQASVDIDLSTLTPNGETVCGVLLGAEFDGAAISLALVYNGTAYPMRDSTGADIEITGIASLPGFYALDPAQFASVRVLRLTSDTNQSTTDTVVTLLTREMQ